MMWIVQVEERFILQRFPNDGACVEGNGIGFQNSTYLFSKSIKIEDSILAYAQRVWPQR